MPKKDYSQWDKKDLIAHIEKLEKRKKYGLVWDEERTREEFELQAQNSLPVLEEVPENVVTTDPEQPTHILIEGDNFHALSVLNYTHEARVDLIFIDPPYNTGKKDFRYNDRIVDEDDAFRHSKWLSFMDRRLRQAKTLLKETGAIFITIDDDEQANLKILCDEIFSPENFIAQICWQKKYSPQNDATYFSDMHDFVLVYAKRAKKKKSDEFGFALNLLPRTELQNNRYSNSDNDPRGDWKSSGLDVKTYSEKYDYPIKTPSGRIVNPPKGTCWRVPPERLQELIEDNRIWFGEDGSNVPSIKRFLSEVQQGIVPVTWWTREEVGDNQEAKQEMKQILNDAEGFFDTPKPVRLMKRIITLSTNNSENQVVLDFFAGSGTTAQAVMELNEEDGGKRQCILVTNNENNICTQVCYPRVKRVMEGYEYNGSEKELLFEEKLTLTKLRKADEALTEYEKAREENQAAYDELKGEFENNTLRLWGIKKYNGWKEGLGGNLKYYRTSFVPAEPSDENKEKLTRHSVEMLCLREGTFDFATETDVWKIYENRQHYTAILFDQLAIPELKEELAKLDKPVSVYVFSLEDDTFAAEFADMPGVTACAIPEAILRVYRRIYQ
jgi:adenine-specific DNA-methyltransferase